MERSVEGMGIVLNPGRGAFEEAVSSEIYVDKTGLISYTNRVIGTEQKFVCVSRPRRFGKSITAKMLAAYYGKGAESETLFRKLSIADDVSFEEHLNQYHVIFLNMQSFFSRTRDVEKMKDLIERSVLWELLEAYPELGYFDRTDLIHVLQRIYSAEKTGFVFIIDEWDCVFREYRENAGAQEIYLDFLRNLLKDQSYIKLAYMTGILPIKKYGSHSALNMFDEFSMTNPGPLAAFTGFTEAEVEDLCGKYHMDYAEVQKWYDGYCFRGNLHIYSPRSVVSAMLMHSYDNFWNKTETFEALRSYVVMNYDGLRDAVVELIAGGRKKINTNTFVNDMTTFHSADDVLTLLIHLGYLGYDFASKEVFIPNLEISSEFCNAVESAGWDTVAAAIRQSQQLLQATLSKDEAYVARALSECHMESSILTYNNENALACVIALAYYSAREYYMVFRELPAGKGFADLVYLPRRNHPEKPAMIVELKWDKSAEGAVAQIKEKKYVKALDSYEGRILLVGINYDPKSKQHSCIIEEVIRP